MARDRIDDADDFDDDRPRRRDRDDRDRDDDRPARRRGPAVSTTVPGVLLLLSGVLAVLASLYTLVVPLVAPDTQTGGVKEARKQAEKMPPGAERDQQVQMYDWLEKNILTSEIVLGAAGLAVSSLIALGGLNLMRQRGYGLAMLGSILALIPCSNCAVCLAMPFGLWALITLMNADVKAAFGRSARPAGPALED